MVLDIAQWSTFLLLVIGCYETGTAVYDGKSVPTVAAWAVLVFGSFFAFGYTQLF